MHYGASASNPIIRRHPRHSREGGNPNYLTASNKAGPLPSQG